MIAGKQDYIYGRHGTPATRALTSLLQTLEGPMAAGTVVTPSGVSAITLAILAVTAPGDHVLVTDSVYDSTRAFCNTLLSRFGISVTYYDPAIGAGIADLIGPRTKVVYVEAPGSQTFEMQDIPAIAAEAHRAGAFVIADNTWATPLCFRPLDHGADIAVQSGTKYITGHSDALLGVVCANERAWRPVAELYRLLGVCVGPDDVSLALRGMRTLAVRVKEHERSALAVARWLEHHSCVSRVLHPALPSHPGHAIWRRDFSGSTGVFGVVLKPVPFPAVAALLDNLRLFGLGYSFGGYESLATYVETGGLRTVVPWSEPGSLIRLQIGLEDAGDLIDDLAQGFDRLSAVAARSRAESGLRA